MKKDKIINNVERCLGDLRRGYFVHFPKKEELLASPENIIKASFEEIKKLSSDIYLIISSNRLNSVTKKNYSDYVKIPVKNFTFGEIQEIAGLNFITPTLIAKLNSIKIVQTKGYKNLLKAFKISELLPAAISIKVNGKIKKYIKKNNALAITSKAISSYCSHISLDLKKVSSAPLILKNAPECEIIAFRPTNGGTEHYAIIVGRPSNTPLVRIHSSCYTGDLLGSLRCDCRDQLHETISYMNDHGGGIVLYLIQEGRGIGLVNKLRAYDLQQNHNLDTVEANNHLGFDDDERSFIAASAMLKLLKIKEVSLVSNNPKKAEELEKIGIKVKSCVPIIIKTNEHNVAYLETKSKKMRHKL